MTAAQPDYAAIVRLLPGDTFTQQTRDEWIRVVAEAFAVRLGGDWEDWTRDGETAVDALLAHLATQQPRPMPGGDPT